MFRSAPYHNAVPMDLVYYRLFLHDFALSFKPTLLFPEGADCFSVSLLQIMKNEANLSITAYVVKTCRLEKANSKFH